MQPTNDLTNEAYTRWLEELVHQLPQAIQACTQDLIDLEEKLAALEGRTCPGRVYWRDRDVPGPKPKLYVNHSIDQVCPVHGAPPPGGRLRVYVGVDPERIREAQEAMALEEQRQELERRAQALREGLQAAERGLREIYRELRYAVPEPGQE